LTSNGPEAPDLVHAVFARVLSKWTQVAHPDNMSAWLRRILFHMFIDVRRRARWEIPTDAAALDRPAEPDTPEPPALRPTTAEVRALVLSLPEHYRAPYELFTFEEMSYEQIAARLAVPSRTVGTRINRARRRLRVLLEQGRRRGR
jgi:RNA polymerase sigma-70 factor (ECF subfamily)